MDSWVSVKIFHLKGIFLFFGIREGEKWKSCTLTTIFSTFEILAFSNSGLLLMVTPFLKGMGTEMSRRAQVALFFSDLKIGHCENLNFRDVDHSQARWLVPTSH